jgi:nudix-type nucleoside diphosphatase (YffH/AdpP family)
MNPTLEVTLKHIVPSIQILQTEILSDNWYMLRQVTFEITKSDGTTVILNREVYDRGNGATILLYNKLQRSVVLTRQFRLPTFVNGNETGMLVETCAGLLDLDKPEDCIKREVMEETGYHVGDVKKIFEAYMSPGAVTESLHFFLAEYSKTDLLSSGGGVEDEDIEVLEMPFNEALSMVENGQIKDGKTIMLLQYAQIHNVFASA